MNQALVSLENGIPSTTSLKVAEVFHKRHGDVIRSISSILTQTPEIFGKRNFALNEYVQKNNLGEKRLPMYTMTRDGFTLLVMGYTGKEAMRFKLEYIEAFNAMEAELANSSRNFPENPGNSLSPAERAELKALVDAKLSAAPTELQGKARSEIWTRFNRHFKIAEYAQLPADKMPDAREYLIQMTVNALRPTVQAQVSTTLPTAEEAETHLLAIGEHIRLIRSHEAALFQLSRKALPPLRKPQDMFSPARRMGLSAFQTMEDCSSTLDYSLKALESSIRTIFSLNRM